MSSCVRSAPRPWQAACPGVGCTTTDLRTQRTARVPTAIETCRWRQRGYSKRRRSLRSRCALCRHVLGQNCAPAVRHPEGQQAPRCPTWWLVECVCVRAYAGQNAAEDRVAQEFCKQPYGLARCSATERCRAASVGEARVWWAFEVELSRKVLARTSNGELRRPGAVVEECLLARLSGVSVTDGRASFRGRLVGLRLASPGACRA